MPFASRMFSPHVERNKEPILDVLKRAFPKEGLVLEIASGTGEHASFMAPSLGGLDWQPSEYDAAKLAGIDAHAKAANAHSVRSAIRLDVTDDHWPISKVDAVLNCNMIHISPWLATEGLMRGVGHALKSGGTMVMYGPYFRKGHPMVPSNDAFDQSLRARNIQWGIRDLDDVITVAEASGLAFDEVVEMPANNLCVVYKKP